MLRIIVKFMLFLFGALMVSYVSMDFMSLFSLLVALSLAALTQYFNSKRFTLIALIIFLAGSLFLPSLSLFIPLMVFDLFQLRYHKLALFLAIPLVLHWLLWSVHVNLLLLLIIFLASLLHYMSLMLANLMEENRLIYDNSTELQLTLQQKNQSLLEKHHNDLYLATLKERNRIAREIHDNVGHLLSRSILQMGALLAINKDSSLSQPLTGLQETLSEAMDAIRGSVHDLRDDSIDLHDALQKMLAVVHQEVDLDYDVSSAVPNEVKYCFLSVLKEATTNINKHSDATLIHIVIREHPAFYQLLIRDNGSVKPGATQRGMGLNNMQERVNALGGNFNTTYQKGFRIFISLPKQMNNKGD